MCGVTWPSPSPTCLLGMTPTWQQLRLPGSPHLHRAFASCFPACTAVLLTLNTAACLLPHTTTLLMESLCLPCAARTMHAWHASVKKLNKTHLFGTIHTFTDQCVWTDIHCKTLHKTSKPVTWRAWHACMQRGGIHCWRILKAL